MKVSFVVPIYKKTAEQVRKCLMSLTTQSHPDIEIVAVFDGADAKLEKVAAEVPRVERLVIEHGGACKARNAGFPETTGEVVSFWDADCIAEPEMAAVWVEAFQDHPEADFVYSGYRFTDPTAPGFASEAFDPWLLERYNYISTMFPLRRERFPGWDESLKRLQDWDYWRRVVKAGGRGWYVEGFGFATDLPAPDDISGANGVPAKDAIETVRRKHEDVDAPILVNAGFHRDQAVKVAYLLKADIFNMPYWRVRDYKMVMVVGFNPQEMDLVAYVFDGCPKETVKVIYWMGFDADQMARLPFNAVRFLSRQMKESGMVHFCPDKNTREALRNMEISAEILALPMDMGEISSTLPEKFKVLVFSAGPYQALTDAVRQALPDVDFDVMEAEKAYRIQDYTVGLQFTPNPRLENGTRNMLLHGRHVISNVQAPYTGYVPVDGDVLKAMDALINRIRALQARPGLNAKAQAYYLDLNAPEKFTQKILSLMPQEGFHAKAKSILRRAGF